MFLRPHSFLSLFGERKELPRPVKKRKETTREPFGWFSGLSIDQSLALDLRCMEVLVFTVSAKCCLSAIIKIACGVVKFQMAKL